MKLNHGFDLLNNVRGQNDRFAFQYNGGYVVREWDGSLNRVEVIQVHGSSRSRYLDGEVTFRYRDGVQHRTSLRYLVSIVVATWMPSLYIPAYFETVRAHGPRVVPCQITF